MRETLTSPSSWRVCQFRHGRGGAAGGDYAGERRGVKRAGRNPPALRLTRPADGNMLARRCGCRAFHAGWRAGGRVP